MDCAVALVKWQANKSIFLGCTFQAKRINTHEYSVRAESISN